MLINAINALPSTERGITLVDIGAAGDIEPRWKKIASVLNYIGFEPDARSRSALMQKPNQCRTFEIHPYAIGAISGEIPINLCRKPMASSPFLPNRSFVDLFPDASRFDVVGTETLPAKRLGDLSIADPDFIKLDIQGGELRALEGAEEALANTIGLEVEVEFSRMYLGQPLFGDISAFLQQRGFEFMDFVSLYRWERKEFNDGGQCVFGDALFMRAPEWVATKDISVVSKYLTLCVLYRRFDIMSRALELLTPERRAVFDKFLDALKPALRRHNLIRSANRRWNSALRWASPDYRAHIIH